MTDRVLTLRDIEFHIEHSKSDVKDGVKTFFSMRYSALREDPNYEGQNESRLLSEWVEICPELAKIIKQETLILSFSSERIRAKSFLQEQAAAWIEDLETTEVFDNSNIDPEVLLTEAKKLSKTLREKAKKAKQ